MMTISCKIAFIQLIWKFELGPCRAILTKRPWQPHHHHLLLLQEPRVNRGALQCPARLVFDNWKKCRRNNFKFKDKSVIKQLQKTQLTFFLKKLDEEFYSGLNLSDGERLRLARYMERIFCDCMNFELRTFLWFWHSCVRKSWFLDYAFCCVCSQSLCNQITQKCI